MAENEQIPIRLGGYAKSHRPGFSGTSRDRLLLMGAVVVAHLVVAAVLLGMTDSTAESGPQEDVEMVEVVEYTDIADFAPDGTLTAPSDEAAKAALDESLVAEPETPAP